jgi:Helix-turn-helix domain
MENLQSILKNRLDRVTRPEPTIIIHRGEEFYLTDTGAQERAVKTFVKFSVKFREQQLLQLKGPPLSVFICLALHIAEDGSCFPSVSLICKETGYNRDTVFEALKKLEFMGYIARKQKTDPRSRKFKSNVYQLFPKSVNFEAKYRVGK